MPTGAMAGARCRSSDGEACAVLAFYPLGRFSAACPGGAGFWVAEFGLSHAALAGLVGFALGGGEDVFFRQAILLHHRLRLSDRIGLRMLDECVDFFLKLGFLLQQGLVVGCHGDDDLQWEMRLYITAMNIL